MIYSKVFKDRGKKFISTDELRQVDTFPNGIRLEWRLKDGGEDHPKLKIDFEGIDFKRLTDVELLNLSISKWDYLTFAMRTTKKLIRDNGAWSCALCARYVTHSRYECVGCPIMKHTGKPNCKLTPYQKFARWQHNFESAYDAAVDEKNFLLKLRNKLQAEELKPDKHELHTLRFGDFVKKANACGADTGKSTVTCEHCGQTFAFDYQREQAGFNFIIHQKKFPHHPVRFYHPVSVNGGMVIGIDT